MRKLLGPAPSNTTDEVTKQYVDGNIVTVTATTHTAANREVCLVNAASNNVTITIPNAAGSQVTVRRIDTSTTYTVTVVASSGLIDGDANATLVGQWAGGIFYGDGTNCGLEAVNGSQLAGIGPGLVPTGLVSPYGGLTAPTGWLLCDNSAVSRTTYAALFAVIGTTYGNGDGSTTFNLPNISGGTGYTNNFVMGADPANYPPGSEGGSDGHIHPLSDAGQAAMGVTTATPFGWMRRVVSPSYSPTHTIGGTSATASYSVAQAVGAALVGQTDNSISLPPFAAMYYIIKT